VIRLLLVGAGHAHLEILRRQILTPLPVELTLASPAARHHYSGMVPGYLQGAYSENEIAFRVKELAERAGGRFVRAHAEAVDPARRVVLLGTPGKPKEIPYDLVSFAVGSTTAGVGAPAVTEHAQRIKPIGKAVELRLRLRRLAEEGAGEGPAPVAVVGGGAAGFEVALAVHADLAAHGARPRVAVLEAGDGILAGYPASVRRRARAILERRGIIVRTGLPVTAVRPAAAILSGGEEIPARITVWLTGATSWPIFHGSGLALDGRGFLLVDDSLRSLSDPRVFAVGDCATLASHPQTPKAGVYAVREAPVLWRSLQAAVEGKEPPRYRPQSGFLSLLNTADGRALLCWQGLVSHSRWAWRLKDRIDRRFMRRYQDLEDR
jgi:pyridine nucleotide-disulfide oxidoreductase family protein